jgi:hypothetical protein
MKIKDTFNLGLSSFTFHRFFFYDQENDNIPDGFLSFTWRLMGGHTNEYFMIQKDLL